MGLKKKTTTEGMIKSIVLCVANRCIKNNNNISQELGLDRGAVTRYTSLLSDMGVLIPHVYKKKRVYYTLNPDIQRYLETEGSKIIKKKLEKIKEENK